MSYRRKQEVYLPGWLWFFLILPLGLLVALLYRQKNVQQFARRLGNLPQRFIPARRYTEPDSIPLEIRPEVPLTVEVETETMGSPAVEKSRSIDLQVDQSETVAPEKQDDLTIIEGIGPKIAGLLREAGIVRFPQLANVPLERLDEILTSARLRHLADPGTWPEQARLAAAGEWDALQRMQITLKGGRRSGAA